MLDDGRRLAPLTKSVDRVLILGGLLAAWALVVALRLLDLQVFSHQKYVELGEHQQRHVKKVQALRGAILDRNGGYLAISLPSLQVVVNPRRIPSKDFAASLLGRVLGIDAAKLQADLEAAAASKHGGYLIVDPNVSDERADALRGMKLDWLEIQQGSFRNYPNNDLAAHVVGNIDGEGKGSAGVERKLNALLAGTPGLERVESDGKQRPYSAEFSKNPVAGRNVGLSIDSELQSIAQEALKKAVIENHGDHGSAVAIDPKTGEILALANYPTYNLNERLHAHEKPYGREDLAVVAPYEPGSVFKVITLSAALETTRLTPDTIIPCGGGVLTIFDRTIHDAERHGDLSFADVLAKSSNVGAIHIGMQVGSANMYEYVRRFGIGQRCGIELPAEAPGMLRRLIHWKGTSLASISFGHEVSLTTVQLARMGSVIANGGFLIRPHVVLWTQTPGGPKEYTKLPPPLQVLKPETVMTMRQLMRRVVLPGGTASHLHLVGYSLAGKTGTAQIYDYDHKVYTHKYNASFIGFAPLNNPSVLIAVTVSGTTGNAGFGAAAAGPAFQTIAEEAMRLREVPRDIPEEVEALEQKRLTLLAAQQKDRIVEAGENALADIDAPTPEELQAAIAQEADAGPRTPDFVGKTSRDIIQQAAAEGVQIEMMGSGLSRAQNPPAGMPLPPGQRVVVRLAR